MTARASDGGPLSRAIRPWSGPRSLGLLAACLLAGASAIILEGLALEQAKQEVAARETLLASLDRALQRAAADSADSRAAPGASLYLAGESETLAAAALQGLVVGIVEGRGGRIATVQLRLPPAASPAPGSGTGQEARPIELDMVFEAGIASLQQILFDIEAGPPAILVQRLQMQPTPGQGGAAPSPEAEDQTLRVVLALRAFWKL